MGINEIFMSYDKWFKYNGFNKKDYNNSTVHMLYRDRWMIWLLPIIVIGVALWFFWKTIPIIFNYLLGG